MGELWDVVGILWDFDHLHGMPLDERISGVLGIWVNG